MSEARWLQERDPLPPLPFRGFRWAHEAHPGLVGWCRCGQPAVSFLHASPRCKRCADAAQMVAEMRKVIP